MYRIEGARWLSGGFVLPASGMTPYNTGFGRALMGMNGFTGADCGMQYEACKYQRKKPEPQPSSQRAFSPVDCEYARQYRA